MYIMWNKNEKTTLIFEKYDKMRIRKMLNAYNRY